MTKKTAILQCATRLFALKGYNETSMAELAKKVGIAQGTIFYHFKTKQDIFLEILKTAKEDILFEFDRYIESRKFETGIEMMEGAISFYLYLAELKEDLFLLLHSRYPYELANVNPVCREHLESIYNCFVDIFEQAILAGKADGSIGPIPAKKTALIVFTMVDGLVRFKLYNLYDAGALFDELIASCRRMLENKPVTG
jgi:AcrR family transcriptional regulator